MAAKKSHLPTTSTRYYMLRELWEDKIGRWNSHEKQIPNRLSFIYYSIIRLKIGFDPIHSIQNLSLAIQPEMDTTVMCESHRNRSGTISEVKYRRCMSHVVVSFTAFCKIVLIFRMHLVCSFLVLRQELNEYKSNRWNQRTNSMKLFIGETVVARLNAAVADSHVKHTFSLCGFAVCTTHLEQTL